MSRNLMSGQGGWNLVNKLNGRRREIQFGIVVIVVVYLTTH